MCSPQIFRSCSDIFSGMCLTRCVIAISVTGASPGNTNLAPRLMTLSFIPGMFISIEPAFRPMFRCQYTGFQSIHSCRAKSFTVPHSFSAALL